MVKAHMRMKKFFILIGCCMMLSSCSNHASEPMEVENSRDHDLVTVDDHASGSVEEEDDRDFALAEVDDHVSESVEAEEKWNDEAVTVNCFEGTFDTVEEFELIDLKPYVISDGQLFWGENDQWNLYSYDGRMIKIFEGDYLCALDEDGNIVVEGLEDPEEVDMSKYGLTGAAAIYHAHLLMEANQSRPFQMLNKSLRYEYVVALCEDGELITIYGDHEKVIPISEDVKEVSGYFILTQNGDVYEWEYYGQNGKIRCNLVSFCPIVKIAAACTAARCIGICEDGSVVMWSDLKELLDLSEWENITSVKMGFNYCAGLSDDGRVYFAAYDEMTEEAVNAFLEGRTASAIACSYHILALLQEDGSVVMVDLNRIDQID